MTDEQREEIKEVSMLHEMLTNYCKKHEEKFKDKPCRVIWTPDNGITLTIFKTSVVVGCKAKETIYGHIKYSDGRLPLYIDLAGARYLIKKLSDKL